LAGKIKQSRTFRGWISGYAFQPGELSELLQAQGLKIIDEVGCESIGAHLPVDPLERIEANPDLRIFWNDLLIETCIEPSIVGISSHNLVVGQKMR
jgi:hypothetical protein